MGRAGDFIVAWRQRQTGPPSRPIPDWITREFARRALRPPHCTPDALARALERERHITIEMRAYASDDPGVYGLLYRKEGCEDTYVILYRPTRNIALHRQIVFHELAHILSNHALTEVAGVGGLRGYMISSEDDAVAEAFAVGAMQYSFTDADASRKRTDADDDVATSAFGHLLKRTAYWP
jgi:anaerobic selenocysteine-containing dehydrogenase